MTNIERHALENVVTTWAFEYFINRKELKHCLLNHLNKSKAEKVWKCTNSGKTRHYHIIYEICWRIYHKSKVLQKFVKLYTRPRQEDKPYILAVVPVPVLLVYYRCLCAGLPLFHVCVPVLSVYHRRLCVSLPLSYVCTSVFCGPSLSVCGPTTISCVYQCCLCTIVVLCRPNTIVSVYQRCLCTIVVYV